MRIHSKNARFRTPSRHRVAFIEKNKRKFRPKRNKITIIDSPDVLKSKLRKINMVLGGLCLASLMIVAGDIVNYMRTGKIDPLTIVMTSLLIMILIPLLLGVKWPERQLLKKRLALQPV